MRAASGKAERKYLAEHAEPEARLSAAFDGGAQAYGHVLVIPASGEGPELERALSSIPAGPLGSVLTILVINATPEAPAWVHEANAQTLAGIGREGRALQTLAPNAVLYPHARGALLVIDRATAKHRLPSGQGVGLARKLGTDLALALAAIGRVASPWLHASDADVEFPGDYFDQAGEAPDLSVAARLYRFRHLPGPDPGTHEAALQYEVTLRYYVLGLRFAGSAYAFHSIGSTLAVHAGAYARVRGFPRRTAAEDFYLLNKLAKVGRIETLRGAPIGLSSRVSTRVPFGTGAAIARMLDRGDPEPATYDPLLFHHLRVWQAALERAVARRGSTPESERELADSVRGISEADARVDPERLLEALDETGALGAARSALAAPTRAVAGRVRDAFDGFRTLKLLHALRDRGLPDLPLREALGRAGFLSLPEPPERTPTGALAFRIEALEYATSDAPGPAASSRASGP